MEGVEAILEKMEGFAKIEESEVQSIKERIRELELRKEEDEIKRALVENERRALLQILNRLASKRLAKLVNSAMHEIIFEERIIDLSNAMEFERQFYEAVLSLMQEYWRFWEVGNDV